MVNGGQIVVVVASLAINAILLVAIFSINAPEPGVPDRSGSRVARQRLTALDVPGERGSTSTVASHAIYVDIDGQRVAMHQEMVPMPWALALQFLGIDPSQDLGRDVSPSNRLAGALSLSDVERTSLQKVARDLFQEVKAIEKAGARLEEGADGSEYFVVEPNSEARTKIVEDLRLKVVQLIGAERGANLMGLLVKHPYFAVEEGAIELAITRSEERQEMDFLLVRNFASGDSVTESRFLSEYSLEAVDQRWGHVLDMEPWKRFVDENPWMPTPIEKSPPRSLLLDGIVDGISIFD